VLNIVRTKRKKSPKKIFKKKKKRHGAQINFGDLPPYLTYDCMFLLCLGNAINDGSKEGKLKKLFLARFEVTKYTRFCFRHYMTKHEERGS
jgi:hypothetical protein